MPATKKRKLEDKVVVEESEDESSEEELEEYEGERDKDGLFHGEGTLIYPLQGVRFKGTFKHGQKCGEGEMVFENDGESPEIITGTWVDDVLQGKGIYVHNGGDSLEGTYVDGNFEGPIKEKDDKGFVYFEGIYKDNAREGKGKLYYPAYPNSGYLECTWVDSEANGEGRYFYPDGSSLQGTWVDDELSEAIFVPLSGPKEEFKFKFDQADDESISSDPLVPDPYESRLVYVKGSLLEDAGEGLFAKKGIESGVVVSFYNGVRKDHKTVDSRAWKLNNNTITLNKEVVIDVPPEMNDTKVYCASLAHKANHYWKNNAVYDFYTHPRFGDIKCIRTIRPVVRDEEITVDYGYKKRSGPKWYKEAKKRFDKSEKK